MAAPLRLSPNRPQVIGRPEPHHHQRDCRHLELLRSYIGDRTAAGLSSAPCPTHGPQFRAQLWWRNRQRHRHRFRHSHGHSHRCTCSAHHQRVSFMSRQRSQHGRMGLCLARMHGSKPSERVHSHPQGGQLSGPNCKFVTHHANVECVLFLIIHFSWTHLMLILDTVCTKNN